MIKKIYILILLLISLAISGCISLAEERFSSFEAGASIQGAPVAVYTLDIGQGDAYLIRVGDEFTLIDTGDVEHRPVITRLLEKHKVNSLKRVIISHPHADHIGGMYAILKQIPVESVYDNGYAFPSTVYKTYAKQISLRNIPRNKLRAGDSIDLGKGARLEILGPQEKAHYLPDGKSDANNDSIVARLVYKEFSMLFTGDMEKIEEEEVLLSQRNKLKATVLKVGHHGSVTSSTSAFLREVRPKAAVISVGLGNEYNHPHKEVIHRFEEHGIKVFRTDEDGEIEITTDGEKWSVKTER